MTPKNNPKIRNHASKVTAEAVLDIRRRAAAGAKQDDLAKEYGVSQPCISHIVRRKNWSHIPREAA